MSIKLGKKLCIRLNKKLEKGSKPYQILQTFDEKLKDMRELEPLVEILTNRGYRARHWEKMEKVLNVKIDPETVTL